MEKHPSQEQQQDPMRTWASIAVGQFLEDMTRPTQAYPIARVLSLRPALTLLGLFTYADG